MLMRFLLLLLVVLLGTPRAEALSELNAKIRESVRLKSAPSAEAPDSETEVQVDETVFVLGSSVDNTFVQVIKKNGQSGWILVSLVDLYRVDRQNYDEYYYALMRERRYTSHWNFHLGASYGAAPLGIGGQALLNFNFLKRGVFDANVDQLELGTGIRYHLGADPQPFLRADGTLFTKPAQAFWEVPVNIVWLFRMGYRGHTMLGPRIGFSIIKDQYSRFETALPALTGFELRHYPADTFGISWGTWVHLRSVIYYSTSFGIDFRF